MISERIMIVQKIGINNLNFNSKRTFRKNFTTCAYSGKKFNVHEKKTIEHIIPQSESGENSYSNYLIVKKDWNEKRSSLPLNEFIKKYPIVKQNIISTVNEKDGEIIEGIDWAEEVKCTLYKAIGYDIFDE